MVEASRARSNVAQALFELRSECGLPITANIKQCLRVLLQRLANCPEVISCQLSSENVVSHRHVHIIVSVTLSGEVERGLFRYSSMFFLYIVVYVVV